MALDRRGGARDGGPHLAPCAGPAQLPRAILAGTRYRVRRQCPNTLASPPNDAKARSYRRLEWRRCVAVDCWGATARKVLPDCLPRSVSRRGFDLGETISSTIARVGLRRGK